MNAQTGQKRRLKKDIEEENKNLQQTIKNLERELQDAWRSVEPEKIKELTLEKRRLVQQLYREAKAAGQIMYEMQNLRHQLKEARRQPKQKPDGICDQCEPNAGRFIFGVIGAALIGIIVGALSQTDHAPSGGH
ncbi:hypothetical protein KAR91_88130 [Candidatus Pacearchaeota archaeon]|nr:hypothetical protein [Candidatus Pacearchaeota archaeon]